MRTAVWFSPVWLGCMGSDSCGFLLPLLALLLADPRVVRRISQSLLHHVVATIALFVAGARARLHEYHRISFLAVCRERTALDVDTFTDDLPADVRGGLPHHGLGAGTSKAAFQHFLEGRIMRPGKHLSVAILFQELLLSSYCSSRTGCARHARLRKTHYTTVFDCVQIHVFYRKELQCCSS